jgi:glycosyl transferase family 25
VKVYILGLRDSFRGEHLITNLRRKGLDAEISYGIDGRNLTPSQLSKLSSNKRSRRIMRRELTPMEIGCALGHRKIYEQFLLSDYEWALILEEDCFITEDFVIDKVRLRKLEGPVIVNLQGVSRILSNYDRFPI